MVEYPVDHDLALYRSVLVIYEQRAITVTEGACVEKKGKKKGKKASVGSSSPGSLLGLCKPRFLTTSQERALSGSFADAVHRHLTSDALLGRTRFLFFFFFLLWCRMDSSDFRRPLHLQASYGVGYVRASGGKTTHLYSVGEVQAAQVVICDIQDSRLRFTV